MKQRHVLTGAVMGQSNAHYLFPEGSSAFINSMTPYNVRLANCGVRSTSIDQWQPGGELYDGCFHSMPQVDFIIFDQGEKETSPLPNCDPTLWAQKFTVIVNAIHKRYGPIPIVFARLGTPNAITLAAGNIHWDLIRSQQSTIYLPNVKMVDMDGIPVDEGLHFSSEGYQRRARRFAQGLKQLLSDGV